MSNESVKYTLLVVRDNDMSLLELSLFVVLDTSSSSVLHKNGIRLDWPDFDFYMHAYMNQHYRSSDCSSSPAHLKALC